ncbi:MAG: PAS domain S-box protein [Spirochaetales bacterium]|nr:PAS domain S-box protein [Spirochaetales bacterium]
MVKLVKHLKSLTFLSFAITLSVTFLAITFLGLFWLRDERLHFREESQELRETYMQERQKELLDQVYTAEYYILLQIREIRERHEQIEQLRKETALATARELSQYYGEPLPELGEGGTILPGSRTWETWDLSSLTKKIQEETLYDLTGSEYIQTYNLFIFDREGLCLGQNRDFQFPCSYTGEGGNPFLQQIGEEAAEGGGFIVIEESNMPGGTGGSHLFYTRYIEEWDWYLASGVPIDEIERILNRRYLDLKKESMNHFYTILILMAVIFLIVLFCLRLNSRLIKRNINSFSHFFEKAYFTRKPLDLSKIYYSEYRELAGQANMMLNKLNQTRQTLDLTYTRLELAIEAAQIGLWDFNLKTGEAFYNESWYGLTGHTAEELEPKIETWFNLVHPQDRERVRTLFEEDMNTPPHRNYSLQNREFRMRHRDGSYRWFLSRRKNVEWEENRPTRMLGVLIDITNYKELQEDLEKSRRVYQQILDTSPIIFCVKNEAGDYTQINSAFQSLFRLPESTVLGHKDGILFPPGLSGKWSESEQSMYRSGNTVITETSLNLFGKEKNYLIFHSPLKHKEEKSTDCVRWMIEITNLKNVERELKGNIEELEKFNRFTINREERMINLKEEVNQLLKQLDRPEKYKVIGQEGEENGYDEQGSGKPNTGTTPHTSNGNQQGL